MVDMVGYLLYLKLIIMSEQKRIYSKGNPHLEPKDESIVSSSQSIKEDQHFSEVPDSYRKGDAFALPQSFIVIISGGDRELDYFHLIIKYNEKFPNIRIETYIEPNFYKNQEPKIFDFAESILSHYISADPEESPDRYYLLTDIDDFGSCVSSNKDRCDSLKIKLIVSNPCFEVWLYYSKKSDKFIDFIEPDDPLKFSSAIKTWIPTVVPGGINPLKAIFDIKENILNATTNYSEDINGIPEKFSTNMFKLAEDILPFVNS